MPGPFANQIQAACRSHNPELIAGFSYNLKTICLPCFVCQMPMLWRCCCPTRQSPLCGTTTALGDSTGRSPRVVLRPKSISVRACLTKALKSLKGKEGSSWEVVIKEERQDGLCQLLTSLLCSPRWQTGLQVNRHPLHLSRSPRKGLGCQPTTEDCLQLPLPSYWVGRNNHWAVIAVLLQKLKQNRKMSDGK